jgi:hypothetical protein
MRIGTNKNFAKPINPDQLLREGDFLSLDFSFEILDLRKNYTTLLSYPSTKQLYERKERNIPIAAMLY